MPTPVGPRNKNEPKGLPGSLNPALERIIVLATEAKASSCPTIFFLNSSLINNNFVLSNSIILSTGIPVHLETIEATSS